jgi:hypothetical protein
MANPERKRLERILRRRRQSQDPGRAALTEELLSEADIGVPEEFDETTRPTKVLGRPDDPGLSAEARQDPEQFSQRYAERQQDAGPERLTINPIYEVGPPTLMATPQEVSRAERREQAASRAMFDTTKQQSWGDQFDKRYNYTLIPVEGGAPILEITTVRGDTADTTGPRKTIRLDPNKPGGLGSNEEAYMAIMDQRMAMTEPTPQHDLGSIRKADETMEEAIKEEEPPPAEGFVGPEQEPGESPIDLPEPGESMQEPGESMQEPGESMQEPGESMQEPGESMQAAEPEPEEDEVSPITGQPRPEGDVGGRIADAMASIDGSTARADRERRASMAREGQAEAREAYKERLRQIPDRPEGDVGGRLADRMAIGQTPIGADQAELELFYEELMGMGRTLD